MSTKPGALQGTILCRIREREGRVAVSASLRRSDRLDFEVDAVAHRLCRILFAMLRDGSDFDMQRIGVEAGHFTRTTTYAYRLTPKPAGRLSVPA